MISVVTITFNNYSELLETIESLKNVKNIQHVVINGGSCEKTLRFLQSYSGKSISEKDFGISDAFNKGINYSDGDAVMYLNSGDKLVDAAYLDDASEILHKHSEVDFIHANIEFVDTVAGKLILVPKDSLPNMPFLHPSMIVRKKVFNSIGGFDLSFKSAMDLDFVYRLIKSQARGFYFNRAVVEMNGSGISSNKPFLGFKEKVRVVKKNRDWSLATLTSLTWSGFKLLVRVLLSGLGFNKIILAYRKNKYLNP